MFLIHYQTRCSYNEQDEKQEEGKVLEKKLKSQLDEWAHIVKGEQFVIGPKTSRGGSINKQHFLRHLQHVLCPM